MNELVKITNDITSCEKKDIAKQIMGVCRAITPQFYKAMSLEDMKAEKLSVELLTADIDNQTLAEMCKRAVLNYPKARSQNQKCFFDINYLLQFYESAFNYIHCDSVVISKKAQCVKSFYDDVKGILYQQWLEPDGKEINIAHIQEKQQGHQYSPKDWQNTYTDIDDIDI